MSEIKYIESGSYRESLDGVIGTLEKRKIDLDEKHYVFVPDRYTLFVEREICSRIGGAFDVEVLTFNRLFSKYFRGKSYLPRHGAVMLLKSVIEEKKKDFGCFSRSVGFKGFAEKMYDTVSMLSACRISPDDLVADGAIKTKIDDVKLIYSEYAERTRGKHVDAAGRGELLIDEVSKRDFSGVHLYFPMHGEFTRQESATVNIMCGTAASCDVYVVKGVPENYGETEFYVTEDVTEQLKAAAKRMRYLSKRGIDYGDMSIIAPQSAYVAAERILKEFDIPFYIDRKTMLGEQALSRYIERLYAAADNGCRAEDVIELSKNYYSGIGKSDADKFENYCIKYRVDYSGFLSVFARGDESEREIPEKVRRDLAEKITRFANELKTVSDADGFYSLIAPLTEGKDVVSLTACLSEAAGVDLSSVPEKIRGTAALLKEVNGDRRVKVSALFEMFFEGLGAGRISPLPKERGVVEVGDGGAFIASRFEHVFIIGMEEGVLPPVSEDCAVITDRDVDVLRGEGITLEPKISELNEAANREFLFSAASGRKLFAGIRESYKKNSFPALGEIASKAESVRENSPKDEEARLCDKTDPFYRERAARHCCSMSNAAEMYLISRAKSVSGGKGLPFETELKDALEESGATLPENVETDLFGLKRNHDIFFYKDSTTISRVQDYFACPYRNFLKNGVRLNEREDGRLMPMDVGTFLHRVIELFVQEAEFDRPEESAKRAVERTLAENEKYALDSNKPFMERLSAEALKIACITAEQIRGGSFVSVGQEMRFGFGKNSDLETLEIDAGGRKIALRGIIDRVDAYGKYARVIDYKTGSLKKTFDFSQLYYGKKIQLMLYMKILEKNGYLPAGMFYFPFSVSWKDDEFSHRLIGVYNGEYDVRVALDNSLSEAGAKSRIIDAWRKVKGDEFRKSRHSFCTEELKSLYDYSLCVLRQAAEEIVSGETGRSPSEGECVYCAYKSVCRADENTVEERVLPSVGADFIISSAESALRAEREKI